MKNKLEKCIRTLIHEKVIPTTKIVAIWMNANLGISSLCCNCLSNIPMLLSFKGVGVILLFTEVCDEVGLNSILAPDTAST